MNRTSGTLGGDSLPFCQGCEDDFLRWWDGSGAGTQARLTISSKMEC